MSVKSSMVTSAVTGLTYDLDDSVRILNIYQAIAYLANNAKLYDLYVSKDFSSNKHKLVFVFSRSETMKLYDRWCEHTL